MKLALFILQAAVATMAAPAGEENNNASMRRGLSPARNLPKGWSYLGCIVDSVSSRTLPYASYASGTKMTGQACVDFCSAKGYPVAGTGK